jgi:hypothetical protein
MRLFILSLAFASAGTPLRAETPKPGSHAAHASRPNAPHALGRFGDWQVASHQEAGASVCYAFVRAWSSSRLIPGRGDVVLTVTQRPQERPAVAVSLGYRIPGRLDGSLQAGPDKLPFYIAGRSAFARNGEVAVTAFAAADRTFAKFAAPKGGDVTDSFSLRGFAAAYKLIDKGCPPP